MSQIKVNSIVPVGGLPSGANGGIIQVVQSSTTTETSTTSTSFVDTGLSASITPSLNSSKILVRALVAYEVYRNASEIAGNFQLVRGSTAINTSIALPHYEAATTSQSRIIFRNIMSLEWLDSPSTTSATTYKVQFKTEYGSSNGAYVKVQKSNSPSTITLMEVTT